MLDPLDLLARLVAIPSVNPLSGNPSSDICGTQRLTEFLEQLCSQLGLTVQRQPVCDGQQNLLARVDGDPPLEEGGKLLLLDAHQDTVAVEGMTIDPFRAVVRDGRVYGRGTCDVKGAMAAMIAAVARLAQHKPAPRPTVVLSFSVNEEQGFDGAKALVGSWQEGTTSLLPRRPDAAIVGEPTDLELVVAHKGVVRWQCTARGRAAHSSQPQAGQNAIYRMARVLVAIERYCEEVLSAQPAHWLCGPPTSCVGLISGGVSVNTVPDQCTISVECRVPPGSSPLTLRQEMIDYLSQVAELAGADWLEHHKPFPAAPPLDESTNSVLSARLCEVLRRLGRNANIKGVPYATNAGFLAEAGVPTVVFGPGSVAQAHTADEWIAVDQLRAAVEIFYQFCTSALQ